MSTEDKRVLFRLGWLITLTSFAISISGWLPTVPDQIIVRMTAVMVMALLFWMIASYKNR